MANIKFFTGENIPLELHKVRIVQKLHLLPVEERLAKIKEAGSNTFLLENRDVFLDMLTDSGVNAMSDRQQAAMLIADDAYAGSETFTRMKAKLEEIFGLPFFLPTHQGRACENILASALVKPGDIVPMNFHFTTTKAHITRVGGEVVELLGEKGYEVASDEPFKGDMDVEALKALIDEVGADRIPFVRLEAGTNLIGGQPISVANMEAVAQVCREAGILLVLDASLLQDNLYFIKTREKAFQDQTIRQISKAVAHLFDVIYFSARKLGFGRGGGILVRDHDLFVTMRDFIPLFEGFTTYGGMSVKEMEAITVGLDETMDEDMISQAPQFIAFMVEEFQKRGIPVVTPAGGLGVHLDASRFVDHIPQTEYPAGALAAAIYIASGVRGMERGTMSEQRDEDGHEPLAEMELVRLALPRRVFTLSQVKYVIDRVTWLFENRQLIGGLRFVDEPKTLRFFTGKLEPIGDWQTTLAKKFREDFGDSL